MFGEIGSNSGTTSMLAAKHKIIAVFYLRTGTPGRNTLGTLLDVGPQGTTGAFRNVLCNPVGRGKQREARASIRVRWDSSVVAATSTPKSCMSRQV